MTTFVGAEYVIANLLIAHKYHECTLEDIQVASRMLQDRSNEEKIDAIYLTSADQVDYALRDFKEYFTYNKDTQIITITQGKNVSDLQHRFLGYLPFNVLCLIARCLK